MNFFEAMQFCWTEGFILCGFLGFVAYESLRAYREQRWKMNGDGESTSLALYGVIILFVMSATSVIAALVTVYSEANWLNAILYGFLLPSAASRWLAPEPDSVLPAGEEDMPVEEVGFRKVSKN